jgi:hypothetical protein
MRSSLMIDTNALEWKLRKLGENVDMLRRAVADNSEYGIRHGGVRYSALGRFNRWPWMN